MKIVAISDTHTKKIDLPEGDILVHSGDCSYRGTVPEIEQFGDWLGEVQDKYQYIVFVPGNHDWLFEKDYERAVRILKERASNVIVLNDSEFTVPVWNVKIWGSPVQPNFGGWAFNRARGEEVQKHWYQIPDDTDSLVTHGPPFGVLDEVLYSFGDSHVGCEMLARRLEQVKPKLCIFGHIHEGYGQTKIDGINYVNASIMDESYDPMNKPVVIDFDVLNRKEDDG